MEYQLVRSKRRTLALKITREGELIACAPYKMPVKEIERFISEKRKWIEDCIGRVSAAAKLPVFSAEEIEKYRSKPIPAVILIPGKSGSMGIGMANIKNSVEHAVGADILK